MFNDKNKLSTKMGEIQMIVDNNGNVFEDRRKENSDRRKNKVDATGGRRQGERRKATSTGERNSKKK